MKKKMQASLGVFLCLAVLVSTLVTAFAAQNQSEPRANTDTYEIYPVPHSVSYADGGFELTDVVSLICGEGVDAPTRKRAVQALAAQDIQAVDAEQPVQGRSTLLIGLNGDGSAADAYAEQNSLKEADLFDKMDAYLLSAQDGVVSILGKDTNAAFYGVTTLKMILEQTESRNIRNLSIRDYSDSEYRGFIEGYYGLPWSNEDRKSLMRFGGEFKMTTYVFAPKDDPYHNEHWRTLYPQEKLDEIADMVQTGIDSKCRFVWTIHPFMNQGINFGDNYEQDLQVIEAKFQQLYDVGVRQFGVLADDAGALSSTNMVRLMTDLDQWVKEKEGVEDLLFCPPGYNKSWANVADLQTWRTMPEDVHIFWTGDGVCGWVNQGTFDYFTQYTGREALMWLNWPVNDINKVRLLMGPGEVMGKNVTGFEGIVSNPMQQAECSKTALFAVADYTWNIGTFDKDKSWNDCFKYIEPDAAEELHTMAKHLQDPTPNGHGLSLPESVELNPKLESFKTKYAAGQSVKEIGNELIAEFDEIIEATEAFPQKSQNEDLKEEIDPWRLSLQALCKANKELVQTAIALEEHNDDAVWAHYSQGTAQFALSKTFPVKNKDAVQLVEAGSKRLIPFATTLSQQLSEPVKEIVAPVESDTAKSSLYTGFTSQEIYGGSLNNITDGNDSTHAWINRYIRQGDYVGLQFNKPAQITSVRVVQGTDGKPQDAFYYGKFQYSMDGQSWTDLNDGQTYGPYQTNIQVSDLDITAKYIRFIVDGALKEDGETNPKWPAFRTFEVTQKNTSSGVYTNVDALKSWALTTAVDSAALTGGDASLATGEYVGIKLPRIRDLSSIAVTANSTEKLALETSMNEEEWDVFQADHPQPARYVRLINRGTDAVAFRLEQMTVRSNEIAPVSLIQNTIGAANGDPKNLFDGNWTTQTQFQGSQANGRYFTYDLGQVIHLDSIKFVLGDGEWDFPRNADVYVSLDNSNWEKILTIGNGSTDVTLQDVFPVHEVSYNTLTQTGVDKDARYLKVNLTSGPGPSDKWVRLNEVVLNGGAYIPQENNPTFVSEPIEKQGHAASNLTDGDLSTTYLPDSSKADSGVLLYRLSESKSLRQINVQQSPGTGSNARVLVRLAGQQSFVEIGALTQSFNVFDQLPEGDIVEIQIIWNGIAPELHELIVME